MFTWLMHRLWHWWSLTSCWPDFEEEVGMVAGSDAHARVAWAEEQLRKRFPKGVGENWADAAKVREYLGG